MASKRVAFTLVVEEVSPVPDFFPVVDPSSVAVAQGDVAQYVVSFTAQSGFAYSLRLDVVGLPEPATAIFSVNPLTLGEISELAISTAGVEVGTYNLELEATEIG